MTVLLICADEQRRERLKDAILSAGFRIITAKALDQGWEKSDFFDFSAVVIDHELKDDINAAAFRQQHITLNLNEEATAETVAIELTNLLRRGSELVQ